MVRRPRWFSATPPVSRALLLLSSGGLLVGACHRDYKLVEAEGTPLELTVTSPTAGEFAGSRLVTLTGRVAPVDADVTVDGRRVEVGADGMFHAALLFPDGDRAYVADVRAIDPDESARILVPFFDGMDPRATDPGAINGLLTPTGLDGLEPVVANMIDSLGWQDLLTSVLPTVDTDYVDLIPQAVTAGETLVDLAPAEQAVTLAVTFQDIQLGTDVVLLDVIEFPITVTLGEIMFGADATPEVDADGMLTLSLSNAQADIGGIGLNLGGFEIPEEIMALLTDTVAGLVADLGAGLVNVLLEQAGTIPLGGPFAFDTDLMGTPLSARLVEVGANLDGIGLGIAVSTTGEAADVMPDLEPLAVTTPSGLPYELGLAVHEGLVNTVLDDTLGSLLNIDLPLTGTTADLMGAGILALPGGDQIPEHEGLCIGVHAGPSRVARFAPGQGAPLIQLWMPDLLVNLDVMQEGSCNPWLDAQVFAVMDLTLDGSELRADLDIRKSYITYYGAEGVDEEAVGESLGAIVNGFASLLMGQLSFDLGDILSGLGGTGLAVSPTVISVEPLGNDGRYGIYMDVFDP